MPQRAIAGVARLFELQIFYKLFLKQLPGMSRARVERQTVHVVFDADHLSFVACCTVCPSLCDHSSFCVLCLDDNDDLSLFFHFFEYTRL